MLNDSIGPISRKPMGCNVHLELGKKASLCTESRRGTRLKVNEEDEIEKWRKIAPIKKIGPRGERVELGHKACSDNLLPCH